MKMGATRCRSKAHYLGALCRAAHTAVLELTACGLCARLPLVAFEEADTEVAVLIDVGVVDFGAEACAGTLERVFYRKVQRQVEVATTVG